MSDTTGFRWGIDETNQTELIVPNKRLVTKRGFIFGQNESGKTSAAQTYAENLLRMGVTCVFVDLVGIWGPGLSLKANGKTPSEFSLAVFGGQYGFMELRPDMGEAIARMVIEERFSTVLDLSNLDYRGQMQTVANFARALAALNQKRRKLTALFIEEANQFLPQIPQRSSESWDAAFEMKRISDIGRNWGFGIIGISPSPQDIDKRLIGQAAWSLWMRMAEPRAILEAAKRIRTFPDQELAGELIETIPTLSAGQGIFVSPEWMKVLAQVKIDKPVTYHFDPEAGGFDETAYARSVDQAKLEALFRKFVEKGKASKSEPKAGPEDGRAVIARDTVLREANEENKVLNRTLIELQEALDNKDRESAQREAEAVAAALEAQRKEIETLRNIFHSVESLLAEANGSIPLPTAAPANLTRLASVAQRVAENKTISKAGKKIFQTLYEQFPFYPDGMKMAHLAVESQYNPKTLTVAIPELKKRGLVQVDRGTVSIHPNMR